MNQPLKAILFDLDGTLLDTAPDFIFVLNKVLEEHNKAPLPNDIIRATVSSGARALVKLAFDLEEGDQGFDDIRDRLLSLYTSHIADSTAPFNGINELLELCEKQRWQWGIVTNKPSLFTIPLLEKVNLYSAPDVVICPDDVTHTKPNPEPLYLACKKLSIDPNEAIYIGDHSRDIEAGKNAGMMTIAAGYGYIEEHSPAESWEATLLANTVSDITNYLINHRSI